MTLRKDLKPYVALIYTTAKPFTNTYKGLNDLLNTEVDFHSSLQLKAIFKLKQIKIKFPSTLIQLYDLIYTSLTTYSFTTQVTTIHEQDTFFLGFALSFL